MPPTCRADVQAAQRRRMATLLQALAPPEGYNLTALPDVR
ncbi:AraC family transcriptional regulator, partial [Xylella fastidiosa subsp. multiplex]|nr:AraC family transcriptional regulator [Xylella fastidiosa subsp. multiplex]